MLIGLVEKARAIIAIREVIRSFAVKPAILELTFVACACIGALVHGLKVGDDADEDE